VKPTNSVSLNNLVVKALIPPTKSKNGNKIFSAYYKSAPSDIIKRFLKIESEVSESESFGNNKNSKTTTFAKSLCGNVFIFFEI
jgi:hypothetical protein